VVVVGPLGGDEPVEPGDVVFRAVLVVLDEGPRVAVEPFAPSRLARLLQPLDELGPARLEQGQALSAVEVTADGRPPR